MFCGLALISLSWTSGCQKNVFDGHTIGTKVLVLKPIGILFDTFVPVLWQIPFGIFILNQIFIFNSDCISVGTFSIINTILFYRNMNEIMKVYYDRFSIKYSSHMIFYIQNFRKIIIFVIKITYFYYNSFKEIFNLTYNNWFFHYLNLLIINSL